MNVTRRYNTTTQTKMKEIWKDIKDYEGLYQISNLGRVKSLKRQVVNNKGYRTVPTKILETHETRSGYSFISLHYRGKKKQFTIHRLVALHFIKNNENLPCINHKDGVKGNNYVKNLEWCTYSENTRHALVNNLLVHPKGENHRQSKITKQQIEELRREYDKTKLPYNRYCNKYGICESHIGRIVRRKIRVDN